ncbi:MAG: germination protein YpeB [Bacillota bacterium]
MKDRRLVWILPAALGLVLLAGVGYWGYSQMTARKSAETVLNNKYSQAFHNLSGNIRNMEVILSKTLVGEETLQDSQLFMRLWRESMAAQSNLGQIPVPDTAVSRTLKFLNQTGDYARTLAVQTAGGIPKTDEQWQTLRELYRQAGQLNGEISRLGEDLSKGTLVMSELKRESRNALRRAGPQLANNNFQTMDNNMQEFPTLIYDGPFSDHLQKKTPAGLGGPLVTADQARDRALAFIEKLPNTTYSVSVVSKDDNAKIPIYRIEVTSSPETAGEKISLGISQQGGSPIWMINSRSAASGQLSVEDARARADRFLADRGFADMESTYHEIRNNIIIFNYAATQGGVILYPDLIKVSVALDDGRIQGFDATNYWMSHRARELPAPALTAVQAREKLSPRLTDVSPGRLALIPKSADMEVLTYEFQGRLDNDVFLIYINALTGAEENVLRVIRTNDGVLTM